jgi:uncharacterized membrane protein
MSMLDFSLVIALFILMMVGYRVADRYVKRLAPKTVKTVNWIGFIIGIVGGILWYAFGNQVYMFITVIGTVTYFLFYDYDKMEEEEEKKGR